MKPLKRLEWVIPKGLQIGLVFRGVAHVSVMHRELAKDSGSEDLLDGGMGGGGRSN